MSALAEHQGHALLKTRPILLMKHHLAHYRAVPERHVLLLSWKGCHGGWRSNKRRRHGYSTILLYPCLAG